MVLGYKDPFLTSAFPIQRNVESRIHLSSQGPTFCLPQILGLEKFLPYDIQSVKKYVCKCFLGTHCNLNPKQIIMQTSAESLADVSSSFLTDLLVAVVSTLFLCRSNRRRRAHGWQPDQDLLGFLMGAPQEGGGSSSRSPLNKAAVGDHRYKI